MSLTAAEAADVNSLLEYLGTIDGSLEYIFIGPIPVTSGDTDEIIGHAVQDVSLRWSFQKGNTLADHP